MSRAYKKSLVTDADAVSSGAFNATGVEQLSGADLEQLRLAAINGSNPAVSAAGVKTVGTNAAHGAKSTVALSGADLERFAGDQ